MEDHWKPRNISYWKPFIWILDLWRCGYLTATVMSKGFNFKWKCQDYASEHRIWWRQPLRWPRMILFSCCSDHLKSPQFEYELNVVSPAFNKKKKISVFTSKIRLQKDHGFCFGLPSPALKKARCHVVSCPMKKPIWQETDVSNHSNEDLVAANSHVSEPGSIPPPVKLWYGPTLVEAP